MDHEATLAYCLTKPGAWRDEPWEGDLVAKVGDKVFAFLGSGEEGGAVGLKCGRNADEAAEWRRRYPAAVTVSPYIGRHGWNVFRLDGTVPDEDLRELIDGSYAAVRDKLPKSQQPSAG